jgi:hypothetical protein
LQEFQAHNINLLFLIFEKVMDHKGIMETVSNGELGSVLSSLNIAAPKMELFSPEEFLKFYSKHLLTFDFFWNG